jgi:recombinational DNA repair protein RecT
MAMKTAMLRHAKWLPMPDDCVRAVNVEERREQGQHDDDANDFIDTNEVDGDHQPLEGDPDAPQDPLDNLANDR